MPRDIEKCVQELKDKPEINNPYALCQYMKKEEIKLPGKKKAKDEPKGRTIGEMGIGETDKTYEIIEKFIHPKAEEEKKPSGGKFMPPKKDIPRFKSEEVDPKEMEMGMKEEMEHSETVGEDKEKIKQIVLDHLKEDPHYYTKLGEVMKASDKLHCFMDWLPEQKKKEFEQLFKQFEVEHFANAEQLKQTTSDSLGERIEKPKFHATPEQGKIEEFVEKKAEEDGAPPLQKRNPKSVILPKEKEIQKKEVTKKAKVPSVPESVKQRDYTIPLRERDEKKAEEEGIKDTIKKIIDPSPPKLSNGKDPALTKTISKDIVKKIKSGV